MTSRPPRFPCVRIRTSMKSTLGPGSSNFPRKLGRMITLAEIPDAEWDALAQRGFDIVWLMGVWQRSASRASSISIQAARASYDAFCPAGRLPI